MNQCYSIPGIKAFWKGEGTEKKILKREVGVFSKKRCEK